MDAIQGLMTDRSRKSVASASARINTRLGSENDLVILVTVFLGLPITAQSALQDGDFRFESTLSALRALKDQEYSRRLLVAFTGDADHAQRMIELAGLNKADSQWFSQDMSLVKFGKGRLEHSLITRSIHHWSLQYTNSWILKITGKYKIKNLRETIKFVLSRSSSLCAWRHLHGRMVDTRIFAFRANSYLEAQNLLDQIDDRKHYYMEHAVFEWMNSISGTCPLLVHRPIVIGLSGSTGVVSEPGFLKQHLIQATTKLWSFIPATHLSNNISRPQFIFVVAALKISGGVLEACRLAQELRLAGESVKIMTMWRSPCEISNDEQLPIIRLTNWKTRIGAAIFQLPIIFFRFSWLRYRQRSSSTNSIWIFTHYSTLPLALLVNRQRRWIFVQGAEWNFIRHPAVVWFFKETVLFFYRRSYLLTASQFLSNSLKLIGLKATGLAQIWADPIYYRPDEINRDIDLVMMLRRGQPKRLDLYISCLEELRKTAPNLRIAVITPDSELVDLATPYTSLCLIRPCAVEMADLYARTKIFLLLSETEGFGLPPLEAMGSGCIPICRDAGGPQSYMQGPLEKYLLPLSMNMQLVCARVLALLEDSSELKTCSIAARRIFNEGRVAASNRTDALRSSMLETGSIKE